MDKSLAATVWSAVAAALILLVGPEASAGVQLSAPPPITTLSAQASSKASTSSIAHSTQSISKLKHINTETTFVRTNGSVVIYKPDIASSAKTTMMATLDPPTAADVAPCIAQYVFIVCVMNDKLATTDLGMGYHIHLDGVTPSYDLSWTNNTAGSFRRDGYEFDSRCNTGWYLDYGGPLAGDEVCWGPGSMDVYWVYPHSAGSYTYRGMAGNVVLATGSATVYPGTLVPVDGDAQTALVDYFAQSPLIVALENYRGERVSFPIFNEFPDDTNPFIFSITGPKNSTGAGFDHNSVEPGSYGTASVMVRAGDKPGQYKIAVTSDDATPLASAFTLTAVARKEPDDNEDDEEGNGEEDCGGKVGDPINIGIGNSFQQEIDYARTGLSLLEFTRSYNALGSKSNLMRNYWTTTFDRAVFPASVGGGMTRVRRPDGRVVPFFLQNGQYVSARPYFHGTLTANAAGWQYVTEDHVAEVYDFQGRWTSISDPSGRTLSATYNSKGLLTKVTANTGESLAFGYNTYNQIATATDQMGRVWAYTYNGYANLTQLKDPDGVYHTYHYESPHSPYLLTGISIGRNQVPYPSERYVTWEFDAMGRATANYFAGGLRRYDVTYNDITGERLVTDALSNQSGYVTRTLNGRGFVDGVVGPGFAICGFADSELERDLNMNITQRTTFGQITQYGDYDVKGQYGFMIEAAGTPAARRTDYAYDPRFIGKPILIRQPSVAPGHIMETQIYYDAAGNVLAESVSGFQPDGTPVTRSTFYQYAGPYGQISQIDGPRTDVSDITRLEYDATTERLLRVTDANGIVVRDNIAYTPTGQLASEDRPNGLHLTYSYYPGSDLLESITETSGADTRTATWTYNDRRWISSLTFSDGTNADLVTSFEYNAAGDLTQISSPDAGVIKYTLDNAGQRQRDSYQENAYTYIEKRWIQRTFDAYGRLKDLINPGNQAQYSFHPDGTLTSITDGRSNVTSYSYDDFKRLTQILQPGQVATTFQYDNRDQLVRVTDANQATTQMLFDDLGNRVRLESPDTGITTFGHDAAGNLIQTVDALGQATSYSYDTGNRLETVDRVGAADDELYTYDACPNGIGKLCASSLGIGDVVNYEYDGLGRIAKQATNAGTVSYEYDGGGNITEITYPSQRKVRYAHDSAGRVSGITVVDGGISYVLVRNIHRLPFGPATSWSFGSGVMETRQYDLQYRPTSFGSAGVFSLAYDSYDGNSNPTQRTINGDSQSFTYDALNRLDTATGSFGTRDYDYDSVGNRTVLIADGQPTTYAYQSQSNRLASDSNWMYARDANGNEAQRRAADGHGWDMTYTAHNRLLGVTDIQSPAAMVGGYRYNALGQRTVKSTPYGDTRFVYGRAGELLSETLPSGSVVQEYVYLDGAPVALLGVPASPGQPTLVDQIIDNDVFSSVCTTARSHSAVNGDYQKCDLNYGYTLSWPWTPPVSGDYDVSIMWAWSSQSQCYRFDEGRICAGAGVSAGNWVPLGQHHLLAGVTSPLLGSNDQSSGLDNLNMDAARYVLIQKDLTERDYKYVHTDALGTPLRVTDKSGAVVWNAVYDPFGHATVDDDPDGNDTHQILNLRFPGQYYDAETGLHYNYFRDYDPGRGNYLEPDPVGLSGGMNTYAYVHGNPVNLTDRLGLDCDQRGCWVTPTQQSYANTGNYSLYYQSACSGGDMYACAAGRVAANQGLSSNFTNNLLRGGLKKNGASDQECGIAMEDIREDLAKAHADALRGGSPQNPIELTGDQISDFHHDVFSQYYGGQNLIFGGDIPGAWVTGWCTAPGCW